jgi:hypothetical protein
MYILGCVLTTRVVMKKKNPFKIMCFNYFVVVKIHKKMSFRLMCV